MGSGKSVPHHNTQTLDTRLDADQREHPRAFRLSPNQQKRYALSLLRKSAIERTRILNSSMKMLDLGFGQDVNHRRFLSQIFREHEEAIAKLHFSSLGDGVWSHHDSMMLLRSSHTRWYAAVQKCGGNLVACCAVQNGVPMDICVATRYRHRGTRTWMLKQISKNYPQITASAPAFLCSEKPCSTNQAQPPCQRWEASTYIYIRKTRKTQSEKPIGETAHVAEPPKFDFTE